MTTTQNFDPFAGGELLRVSPATAPQREILAAAKMSDEANTAFNEGVVLRVRGELDVELLEICFNEIVRRHDVLQATFSSSANEICLHEPKHLKIDFEDLSHLAPSSRQKALDRLFRNIAISPMNLEEGPLLFVWVKRVDASEYDIVIAAHHVVCDGWSFGVLLEELTALYRSRGDGQALSAAPSFFDFAEQQAAAEVINADTDFWLERFESLPPTLDLPLDRVRPAARSFRARRVDFSLDSRLVADLPKVAASLKSSVVNVVLAGYFALLYRLTGNRDIVVGLPVAGQAALNQLKMFGHMVQLLPIRLRFSGETSFAQLVGLVKEEVLTAREHANFTFGRLIEKTPVDRSRVPLINTIFNIDQPMPEMDFGTATATVRSIPRAAESFEMFLNIVPSGSGFLIETTYSTALFSEQTVTAWLASLERILVAAVSDTALRLDDLKLADDLPPVVKTVNQTAVNVEHADFIFAFRASVKCFPDAVAVAFEDKRLTYRELDQRSTQLAHRLIEQGVIEGDVVGVCLQRSEMLVVATLGVLKTGAAYLPLDPEYPVERLVYMLEDSEAKAVIHDHSAPSALLSSNSLSIDVNDSFACDSPTAEIPAFAASPGRVAYTIYTSGSTGKPKGVKVQNSAMINFLESMARVPGFSQHDRLLAVTTLAFDIAVLELYLPLLAGGASVIAGRDDVKNGEKLAALIAKHGVTVMQATPSTWRLLLAGAWRDSADKSLKALCGGEPLPRDLACELCLRVASLWNMYGPTEATVWSTLQEIRRDDAVITVGQPIANTQVYILDRNLNPLPVSVPGELCIGGAGVALGYHNRPDMNADRFVHHPVYGRIYRTGDVAKVLSSGEIQHMGRLDDQVKLRGYRIELGEIEAALAGCAGVRQAAVYLWELSEEDVRIVACCVPEHGVLLDTITIRKQLRAHLPPHMIPQYVLGVDEIALTPNGKVDRRALPRPEVNQSSILSQGVLKTDTEKRLAGLWTDLLKPHGTIGRDANFFEIGGHSLLALEAIRKIETMTGVRLEPRDIVVDQLYVLAGKIDRSSQSGETTDSRPKALPPSALRRPNLEQTRILQRHLAVPGTTCNNLPAAWLLSGQLDVDALTRSLSQVFERQSALRTVVLEDEQGYRLGLRHGSEIDLPEIIDMSGLPDALDAARSDATRRADEPFAVIDRLLCRVLLYKIDRHRHLLVLIPHQLIFDGWSFDIFLSELEAYYEAALQDRAVTLDPLPFHFRDFAEWSRLRMPAGEDVNHHRNVLQAISEIKYTLVNFDSAKGQCHRKTLKLNKASLAGLEAFCKSHRVRLHEVLLTAIVKATCDCAQQDECCIALPVTGRYIPEVIGLIGSFVSVLPVEIRLTGGSFVEAVREVAARLKHFHEHQELSFAELIQAVSSRGESSPVDIPMSFSYQDARQRPQSLADLSLHQIDIVRYQTELPLECWARVQPDGVFLVFDYDMAQVEANHVEAIATGVDATLTDLERAVVRRPETARSFWKRLFQ